MLLIFAKYIYAPMKYSKSFVGKQITVSKELHILELSG
jgi:hypothetical protein